jgi:hypothetical protein
MHNTSTLPARAIALFVTLISLLGFPHAVSAQTTPLVRITPQDAQVPLGEIAQIAVEIVDVQALYGMDIQLRFDPAVLEVVGATPEAQAQVAQGNFMDAGFVVINKVDNEAGTVRYVMTQLNPSTPKDGTGVLIVMNVRGKKDGATTAITLDKVDMARRDGTTFGGTLVSGQARVLPASQLIPAATRIPTQGVGTQMPTPDPTSTAVPTTAPAATQPPAPTSAPATPAPPAESGPLDSSAQTAPLGGAAALGLVLAAGILIVFFVLLRKGRKPAQ